MGGAGNGYMKYEATDSTRATCQLFVEHLWQPTVMYQFRVLSSRLPQT